jgi:hypothetical protein
MQRWILSVADAFGHVDMSCKPPTLVHLLWVPHEVSLVKLVTPALKLDDTTVLFQSHEDIFCNDECKSNNYHSLPVTMLE